MRKRIVTLITALAVAAAMSMTAFAAGWQNDSNGYWWQNNDGSFPVNSWQWLDGNNDGTAECYYFDEAGYLLANTTTPDGCTVNSDGAWTVNGTIQTQTEKNNSGFTKKISNTIWDLMDHTYGENKQKYGKLSSNYYEGQPYEMTYYTGLLSEEEKADITPYIISVNSQKMPLNMLFEDAPDIETYTSLEAIGQRLEDLGYTVEWGKTSLGADRTCWIRIDRFDIAFTKGYNGSFNIKFRQALQDKASKAMGDAMGSVTSAN